MNMPPEGTLYYILIATIVAAIVGKYSDILFKKIIYWPIAKVWNLFYKLIAPSNFLSLSFYNYKRHILRSKIARIETVVGPVLKIPLEQAYAPIKFISREVEQGIDLFEHTSKCNRFIVLGGPGTGKTTQMKCLIINMLEKKTRTELDKVIPVFIVLRKLASKKHTVKEAIIAAFEKYNFPKAHKYVETCLTRGKMLIILDGLDEVGVNKAFVNKEIREFCENDDLQQEKNHVIVTCREHSYQNDELRDVLPNVVKVEPFANHHIRIFLKGWPLHHKRNAIQLYSKIQDDPVIRDICRNPLMLTILTGLYMDVQNFEIPTNRTNFYENVVDELMIKRPERREIKQIYHPKDKIKILERISLERLETVRENEDPEELSTSAIRKYAYELWGDEYNIRKLIEELVDFNGIIKMSGNEAYTCSHRTIQEYLAAREAHRTKNTKQFLEQFSEHDYLIEVVYFYCGLIRNIPQINEIVSSFTDLKKWKEAGRCILFTSESPNESEIRLVSEKLLNYLSNQQDVEICLELLSSLTQKRDAVFESTREIFNHAIDLLAKRKGDSDASALETVLSASPEIAMKVIPGLLQHDSGRWKRAAVKLLHDIGTDDALDKLIQLLESSDSDIKYEASLLLADLIKTRKKELLKRKDLLPNRQDLNFWPLEDHFPSQIALPMAEALVGRDHSSNFAINSAAKAIEINTIKDKNDKNYLRAWYRIPFYLKAKKCLSYLGDFILAIGLFSVTIFNFTIIAITMLSFFNQDFIMVDINSFQIHSFSYESIINLNLEAKNLATIVEEHYPSNASGISRILPWNWEVEPILPDSINEAYKILLDLKMTFGNLVRNYKITQFHPLLELIPSNRLDEFYGLYDKALKVIPDPEISAIAFHSIPSIILIEIIFILVIMLNIPVIIMYKKYFNIKISPRFLLSNQGVLFLALIIALGAFCGVNLQTSFLLSLLLIIPYSLYMILTLFPFSNHLVVQLIRAFHSDKDYSKQFLIKQLSYIQIFFLFPVFYQNLILKRYLTIKDRRSK
ncbi:MAG: NACHT domain-containing protein [candidate division Zixibacteria bacterium]|nr:NACHT domain-containing protein [candidate division Zixibacteria bacterium]